MNFEESYELFINAHLQKRNGERRKRLEDGCGHAEKLFLNQVWWPAFGHFQELHPEYEVFDFKDGCRFLDFAYIRPFFRLAIEIDGHGPHWRNISRWQFSDHLLRQNHLTIDDGWRVLRFSYDDLKERPRLCQQIIQQFMGRWFGEEKQSVSLTIIEKEIVRLALRLSRPLSPQDVCDHLGFENKYARKLLHGLKEKTWLQPDRGTTRIRTYRLDLNGKDIYF